MQNKVVKYKNQTVSLPIGWIEGLRDIAWARTLEAKRVVAVNEIVREALAKVYPQLEGKANG